MDNKTIKILENIDSTDNQTLDKQKLLNLLKLTKENNINIFDDKKGKIKSKKENFTRMYIYKKSKNRKICQSFR